MNLSVYNRHSYLLACLKTFEEGLQRMAPNVVAFSIFIDTTSIQFSHIDISFLLKIGNLITNLYPERLHRIYFGPNSWKIGLSWTILCLFLPNQLKSAIAVVQDPKVMLAKLIKTEDTIPSYWGVK
eukprot:c14167_g1_i1.p1 GENE.c14167_g1_i1~~c14167_g1_i1.p1  ORF type:complete len:126 (+),score=43.11 c14167_g1_i1:73-450(+)